MLEDLSEDRLCEIINLFKKCFKENGYYEHVFGDEFDKFLEDEMIPIIKYLIENGGIIGYFKDNKLVGFMMHFEYKRMHENPILFRSIFGNRGEKQIPYKRELHNKILKLDGNIEYILCIGVDDIYRHQNIAGDMLDFLIKRFSNSNIAVDITNMSTLPLYKLRNFNMSFIDTNYVYAYHLSKNLKNDSPACINYKCG